MEKSQYIEAGRIINTHAVAGEVKVDVWLDSPDFLKKFKKIYLGAGKKEYTVTSARIHKGFLLCKLEGIDDVNAAMTLKNTDVFVLRSDAEARLGDGRYFLGDIIGARVVTPEGEEIGTLTEIFETPAAPVYVVKGEREHMIPAVKEFIKTVDLEKMEVVAELIEGM